MDMSWANQRPYSRGSRPTKAFDTRNGCGATAGLSNALQLEPDFLGRLYETLIYSNSIQFQSHEIEASPMQTRPCTGLEQRAATRLKRDGALQVAVAWADNRKRFI